VLGIGFGRLVSMQCVLRLPLVVSQYTPVPGPVLDAIGRSYLFNSSFVNYYIFSIMFMPIVTDIIIYLVRKRLLLQ